MINAQYFKSLTIETPSGRASVITRGLALHFALISDALFGSNWHFSSI